MTNASPSIDDSEVVLAFRVHTSQKAYLECFKEWERKLQEEPYLTAAEHRKYDTLGEAEEVDVDVGRYDLEHVRYSLFGCGDARVRAPRAAEHDDLTGCADREPVQGCGGGAVEEVARRVRGDAGAAARDADRGGGGHGAAGHFKNAGRGGKVLARAAVLRPDRGAVPRSLHDRAEPGVRVDKKIPARDMEPLARGEAGGRNSSGEGRGA